MKRVALLVPNGTTTFSSLVLTIELIENANAFFISKGKQPVFTITVVSSEKRKLIKHGAFAIQPHKATDEALNFDLIIIPAIGENIISAIKNNKKNIDWIVEQYKHGAEVATLCTGAFLLAAGGLLNGRQCSTHWSAGDTFQQMFPGTRLAIDKIIIEEHGIYTTGGALSSLNLVLHLIEKYYNRETAIYSAKIFQIDLDRNNQSAFIIFSGQKDHADEQIKKAQLFIEKNVGEKIVIEKLSQKFSIDRRNFDRRFKKATGNTPMEYMQRTKVEAAKKYFETSRKTVNEVMYEVGYADMRAFRELFKKITGMSPIAYRRKYNKEVMV